MILFFTVPPLFYLLARFIAHQKSNPHHGTNYKTTTTIQYYQHTHTHTHNVYWYNWFISISLWFVGDPTNGVYSSKLCTILILPLNLSFVTRRPIILHCLYISISIYSSIQSPLPSCLVSSYSVFYFVVYITTLYLSCWTKSKYVICKYIWRHDFEFWELFFLIYVRGATLICMINA